MPIGWAAGAAALGSVASAAISAGAAGSAAQTQAQGATQAAQIQANAQLQGLQLVQQQEQPYSQAGLNALTMYQQLLGIPTGQAPGAPSAAAGIPGGSAAPTSTPTGPTAVQGQALQPGATTPYAGTAPAALNFDLTKMPGYAFQMQQGQQAIEQSAAARGTSLSGATLQSLQGYGQGLASTQFQNYLSQLAGISNMGQAAATGVANQGASLLSGAGASQAAGIIGAANAGAAGQMGIANAATQGIGGVTNSFMQQQLMKQLFQNPGGTPGGSSPYTYTSTDFVGPPAPPPVDPGVWT